jgi:hypothetical protein
MKMKKKQVMATIGALGLTAGVLAGCGGQSQEEDDYVKVVNSEGETVYISEDEFEDAGGNDGGMFMMFAMWNGNNHSKLKSSKGFKGSTFKSKPTTTSGAKSGSGIGKSSTSGKSSGFGG